MNELLLGVSLGWAAGISPGPLFALVVTTAIQKGTAAAIRVAVAPLITDAPVVALTVAVLSAVPDRVVRGLGIVGGVYLVWLGSQEIRAAFASPVGVDDSSGTTDLWRGALTNVLNPQMWTFWIAVGAPIVATAASPAAAASFLFGFYTLLVGSKVVLAVAIGASRERLLDSGRMRALGVLGGVGLIAIGLVLAFRG
jgi:threonine/homoserine/homoserine lactone efflux protein